MKNRARTKPRASTSCSPDPDMHGARTAIFHCQDPRAKRLQTTGPSCSPERVPMNPEPEGNTTDGEKYFAAVCRSRGK